ncbi:hypothetical protein FHG87_013811 [Trinorchestia longiramus]|nr:hypothetical protein FHG87_013811 [Trinorchestia longiramus]
MFTKIRTSPLQHKEDSMLATVKGGSNKEREGVIGRERERERERGREGEGERERGERERERGEERDGDT